MPRVLILVIIRCSPCSFLLGRLYICYTSLESIKKQGTERLMMMIYSGFY